MLLSRNNKSQIMSSSSLSSSFEFVDTFDKRTREIIDEQFGFLDKSVSFCNYGSFGVVPKDVLQHQFKFMTEVESDPDRWMRSTSMNMWLENREAVSKYFGTAATNLAFVTNTTSAVNAVLSSISWKSGDVIIITDWTFSSVKAVCEDLVARHDGVDLYHMELPYPIRGRRCLVSAFTNAVDQIVESGRNPRLAIVDAVSSMPAVRFPYERITQALKNKGVQVLVDGAHAPGQVEIDLDNLGADYFAGNLHKWFFCPKGTAVLYVPPQHQSIIRAPVVSMSGCALNHGCKLDDVLATHFFWQGTSNNTSYACVKKAIEFIESVGGLKPIIKYNESLSTMAAKMIVEKCKGSSTLFDISPSVVAPFMQNIIVRPNKPSQHAADYIQVDLYRRHKVWTSASRFRDTDDILAGHEPVLFRLSTQICNKMEDYNRLAVALKQFIAEGPDATHSG